VAGESVAVGEGESVGVGDSDGVGVDASGLVDASVDSGGVSVGDGLGSAVSDGWGGRSGSAVGTGGVALGLPPVNTFVGSCCREDRTITVPTATMAASRANPMIEFLGVKADRMAAIRWRYARVGIAGLLIDGAASLMSLAHRPALARACVAKPRLPSCF
jgi:hypothetical protein